MAEPLAGWPGCFAVARLQVDIVVTGETRVSPPFGVCSVTPVERAGDVPP